MAELKSRPVTIAVTDTLLSPKKSRNGFLIIENTDAANPVEITFGEQAAVVNEGHNLIAGARLVVSDPGEGEIRAIATGGNVVVTITD